MGEEQDPGPERSGESPTVAVFTPNPLLSVVVEARGRAGDDVHFHPGGQGVWLSRMAKELGASPRICGFRGGESGAVLEALITASGVGADLVATADASGCFLVDRRSGERLLVGHHLSAPASRHEADDLLAAACTAALDSDLLAVCNPYPVDSIPLELYERLVIDSRAAGVPVIVDLSTPRLEVALKGSPELVKLNDWELAEFAADRVDGIDRVRAAADPILAADVGTLIVTRGADPAYVLRGDDVWELVPPKLEAGSREGCGDTMMGAIAASRVAGEGWERMLRLGAAAGAANFLRHGLGTGDRATVEGLFERVELRPIA